MKTSNKLIITALLLVFISLIGYDYVLKTEYTSGKYNDPYYGFVTLKYRDFDIADIISSTAANVKFVQGPYSVRIDTNAMDYTTIKQRGKHLEINANFKGDYLYNPNAYILVVSCPELKEVNVNAIYRSNNREVIDSVAKDDWRKVLIDGFKQDTLQISQDYGSTIVLANNVIGSLNAVAGKSTGSGSKIIVLKKNQFRDAKFDILNKSQLLLSDANIQSLSFHVADSAKLVLSGSAQHLLNNLKSYPK